MLGTGFGGEAGTSPAAPRFSAAQLGDYVVFTNDYDKPKYHVLEAGDTGDGLIHEFPDLATIGLTRAAVVWEWQNCIFFADLDIDGARKSHMLIWSNFDDPTSFDPSKLESITGSKELYTHERILAGHRSHNGFLIYTTHGIWEMTVVGGEQSFAFRRVYNAEENEGKAVLAYPNTLIATKENHIYAAEDGFYAYNQYFNAPERVEWAHRSSSFVYDDIDSENCMVHVGVIHGDEALFSFAKTNSPDNCPSVTLRFNLQYNVADTIDAGFTAFTNARSFDVATIRDFIVENEICTLEELQADGYGYGDEGLPNPLPSSTG